MGRVRRSNPVTLFLAAALGLSACAGPAALEQQTPTTSAASEPTAALASTSMPAAPPPSGSGRDIASINVCQVVTPAEVADLAGGAVREEPNQSSDRTASLCWYKLEASDGGYEYYIVYVTTIEIGELTLSFGEAGDPVAGLGDEAYLRYEDSEAQYRLLVLMHADYSIDMAGSRSQVMLQIAELLLERL